MQNSQRESFSMSSWFWTAVILGAFFVVLYVVIGFFFPKTDHFTSEAQGYVSKVVQKENISKKRGRYSYTTYVTFTDSDYQTFTAPSFVSDSKKRHEEGDIVTVHFDPREPESVCVIEGEEDELYEAITFRAVSGIGGGLTLVVCTGYYLYCRFYRRR